MKKIVLIIAVALMGITLSGCGAKYTVQDVDKAAEQLTAQQNIDSAIETSVNKGDYDQMVDDASKSLNAFKNSSSAANLPPEIINGLSKHIEAHKQAKIAWQYDQDQAQADYDVEEQKYLDDPLNTEMPDLEDYLDKYNTVQDAWASIPSLQAVTDSIKECRKDARK